ncbi:MAG: DUF6056 family protein, partial [Akkermansia sp.]
PGVSARMNSAAPGCAVPLSGIPDRLESVPVLLARMHEYLALPLLLGLAAAWVLWKHSGRDRKAFLPWRTEMGTAAACIMTAYAMALSFCAAVIPADHAMFSATVLFGTGVMALIHVWYGLPGAVPRPRIFIVFFLVFSSACVASTLYDHLLMYRQHRERVNMILEQKKAGIRDLSVPPFVRPSPWCSFIFWVDLSESPEDYVNRGAASYYGIRSIRTK